MVYATLDSNGTRIVEGAHIQAFETREAAVRYLLDSYDLNYDGEVAVEAGDFGDAWVIVYAPPGENERYFAPFKREDLIIRGPGQHPGGRAWWIEPVPEVLVGVLRESAA